MLLGAIVDAGLSLAALREELAKLEIEGYRLQAAKTQRGDLAATKVTVELDPAAPTYPRLSDVLAVIDGSDLPPADKEKASAVFQRLAEAEARVHGVDVAVGRAARAGLPRHADRRCRRRGRAATTRCRAAFRLALTPGSRRSGGRARRPAAAGSGDAGAAGGRACADLGVGPAGRAGNPDRRRASSPRSRASSGRR